MAMTEEHKRLLKANHSKILDRIVDVEIILDHLYELEIISQNTQENINLKPKPRDKARELLAVLPRLGERAYHAFLLALQRTNQMDVARLIDPNYQGPDSVDQDASEIAIIESYRFDDLPMKMMSDADIYMHINNKKNYIQPFLDRNSDLKVGRVLIINNKEFDILENRDGSDNDVYLLKCCFERLRFVAEVHENKTALEVEAILRNECTNYNNHNHHHHSQDNNTNADINIDIIRPTVNQINNDANYDNTSIFILVIMTHGAKDHIYGTDGYDNKNLVSIETIQKIFSSENCPGLAYKPKLFFIQACQRDNVKPMMSEATNVTWRPTVTPGVKVGNSKDYVHPLSDMFLMMSTVLGKCDLSWRHPEMGSYFIRAIVYVITTKCHEMELSEMMRRVKDILCSKPIQTDKGPIIQQPEVRDTLRKGLWFLC